MEVFLLHDDKVYKNLKCMYYTYIYKHRKIGGKKDNFYTKTRNGHNYRLPDERNVSRRCTTTS